MFSSPQKDPSFFFFSPSSRIPWIFSLLWLSPLGRRCPFATTVSGWPFRTPSSPPIINKIRRGFERKDGSHPHSVWARRRLDAYSLSLTGCTGLSQLNNKVQHFRAVLRRLRLNPCFILSKMRVWSFFDPAPIAGPLSGFPVIERLATSTNLF